MTRDREILAAAEKLRFERSIDGVGVDESGGGTGISGSAIYSHFMGKARYCRRCLAKPSTHSCATWAIPTLTRGSSSTRSCGR